MLVLTRKANEQILIGDDIKITLVRVRGNSVRVGIEAPRDVRVVRGELARKLEPQDEALAVELGEREQVFAHPQPRIGRHYPQGSAQAGANATTRLQELEAMTTEPLQPVGQVYVGRIRPASGENRLHRAPLAGYVSAT